MPNFANVLIGDQDPNTPAPNPQDPKETTPLDGEREETPIDQEPNNPSTNPSANPPAAPEPIMIGETEITEGYELETPDGVLTFKNGELVNAKGEVFKKADEVKDYLAQFNDDDDDPEQFNIAALQNILGVDITDENGKPVEFTDDAEGRAAYVNKFVELKQKEATDIALNTFFANNPLVKQFNDYVTAGGDPKTFGQIPDRTGIQFDPENVNQHKAIIRASWADNNNRGDVEKYIKYLEDSGALADTAKVELEAIKERDNEYKKSIAEEAAKARKQEQEEMTAYYNKVNSKIVNGVIGGYKIPETVTKEVNGQKIALTRKDFFNYVTRVNPETHLTAYQADLKDLDDDEYMNRELLNAYLHFCGGTYEDLIKMAVKEEEVKRLKLIAKTAKTPGTIKINKPSGSKVERKDIIL